MPEATLTIRGRDETGPMFSAVSQGFGAIRTAAGSFQSSLLGAIGLGGGIGVAAMAGGQIGGALIAGMMESIEKAQIGARLAIRFGPDAAAAIREFAESAKFEMPFDETNIMEAKALLRDLGKESVFDFSLIADAAAAFGINIEQLAMSLGRVAGGNMRSLQEVAAILRISRTEMRSWGLEIDEETGAILNSYRDLTTVIEGLSAALEKTRGSAKALIDADPWAEPRKASSDFMEEVGYPLVRLLSMLPKGIAVDVRAFREYGRDVLAAMGMPDEMNREDIYRGGRVADRNLPPEDASLANPPGRPESTIVPYAELRATREAADAADAAAEKELARITREGRERANAAIRERMADDAAAEEEIARLTKEATELEISRGNQRIREAEREAEDWNREMWNLAFGFEDDMKAARRDARRGLGVVGGSEELWRRIQGADWDDKELARKTANATERTARAVETMAKTRGQGVVGP